jgi:hypothetical protein
VRSWAFSVVLSTSQQPGIACIRARISILPDIIPSHPQQASHCQHTARENPAQRPFLHDNLLYQDRQQADLKSTVTSAVSPNMAWYKGVSR